jgi:hypothetical protein
LRGLPAVAPKNGARFHFDLPGSVQGFVSETGEGLCPVAAVNVAGHSRCGKRSLALKLASGTGRAATATFVAPSEKAMPGYELIVAPTLYPGQTVTALVQADAANTGPVPVQLFLSRYASTSTVEHVPGPTAELVPGATVELSWKIGGDGSQPICRIGLELAAPGTVYLDWLTWDGAPDVVFAPPQPDAASRKGWVKAVDLWESWGGFCIGQNEGRGLLATGCREWRDYTVSAAVHPVLLASGGIAARVQGLKRFYALMLVHGGKARLIKALDGDTVLAEAPFDWELRQTYDMAIEVKASRLRGWINGRLLFDVEDHAQPLTGGGVALVVEEGRLITASVKVAPA